MYITTYRNKYGNVLLYYGLIFLIIVCFIQILPHLELIITPKIRIFTPQKLIYYLGVLFVIDITIRRKIGGLISKTETIIIVSFILSMVISSISGVLPKLSLINVARHLGYILMYIMISNIFMSYKDIERVLFCLIPVGVVFFLLGVFIYHDISQLDSVDVGYRTADGTRIERITAFNMNANSSAYIAVFLLVITIFFFLKTRFKEKQLFVYYPLMILFSYIYINTLARGPFVCLIIALISISYFYPMYKRRRELITFALILFLTSLMIALPYSALHERILRGTAGVLQLENVQGYEADMSYQRVEMVLMGIDLIKERPFFGRGFLDLEENLLLLPFNVSNINHFFYIQFAVYVGIIGLLLYLLFFVTVIKRFFESIRRLKKDGQSSYVLGSFLLGLFVIAFAKGIFAPTEYDIWIAAGLCSAFCKIESREQLEQLEKKEQKDNHLVNRKFLNRRKPINI